jgi:hypothetical protein
VAATSDPDRNRRKSSSGSESLSHPSLLRCSHHNAGGHLTYGDQAP